jgi:hypothetical protein
MNGAFTTVVSVNDNNPICNFRIIVVTWEMGKTDLNPQGVRMASQLFSRRIERED